MKENDVYTRVWYTDSDKDAAEPQIQKELVGFMKKQGYEIKYIALDNNGWEIFTHFVKGE